MEEIQLEVSSFESAKQFFLKIGFVIKFEVEKTRERWVFDDIKFDIDTYPLLSPLLEIESESWQQVDRGIELLGLDKNKKRVCTAYKIYKENNINPKDYIIIKFDKQVKRIQSEVNPGFLPAQE